MTIAIDDVCTHADLASEVGGTAVLEDMLPSEWAGSSATAREAALRDVLTSLRRRTPAIREEHLLDVTELRDAVAYGALERIYRAAMTTPDGLHAEQRKLYSSRFDDECAGLVPTLLDDEEGSAFSFSLERR